MTDKLPMVDNEKWIKDSFVVVSGGNQDRQHRTRWDPPDGGQGRERGGM